MGSNNNLEILRDEFRNAADILDELLALEEKEKVEDVSKECESIMGRFVISMAKISVLANDV
ncbi:hypothetical protein JJB61_07355 [Clostridium perfringens]|uniref:hypothetical protein n=1 Tax=Clostridium perfringens TaxID=1502 RepID=UPI000D7146AC|nr:hypothetical protein [Clostridium perfringens]ELC8344281.1 hypothetical protein [Clostridium perfringens]MBO3384849.1 hypothetical protein [Clostridium perfringens]MBO3397266.1 hypothetical protein [Clostridium perfringens]MBO3435988.1 hypothetical protein [Clostridium perfringens]MCX0402870.1 hypothetical protein [Clostridium perfringens]